MTGISLKLLVLEFRKMWNLSVIIISSILLLISLLVNFIPLIVGAYSIEGPIKSYDIQTALSQGFTILVPLLSLIFGAGIISNDIKNHWIRTVLSRPITRADFLLTKPVSRAKIMTSKLLAAVASLVITNVVYLAVATMMASMVETKEYSTKVFVLLSLTLFFLQLIFLALGIIVSVVVPRIKSILPISLGTVFAFFVIGALASTTGDNALRYISPFKYFDFAYIVQNSSYETSFMMVGIGFIAIAIVASYFIYAKRDIHAV